MDPFLSQSPTPVCQIPIQAVTSYGLCHTQTNTSCPIPPNTHRPHMLSVVTHTQSSWPQQGLLTQGVMSCHSHTHGLCPLPPSTHRIRSNISENPYTPICLRDSNTNRTLSLSTSPCNSSCHLHLPPHTQTTHHPFPIYHTHTSGSHHASHIHNSLSRTSSCHTDHGHPSPQTLTSSYVPGVPTGLPAQSPPSSVPCSQ